MIEAVQAEAGADGQRPRHPISGALVSGAARPVSSVVKHAATVVYLAVRVGRARVE